MVLKGYDYVSCMDMNLLGLVSSISGVDWIMVNLCVGLLVVI